MQARSFTFAALATGLFFVGHDSAPVTTRYRIQQSTEQEVDLTAAGQGKQQVKGLVSLFTALATTDSAGGKTVTFTVDSVSIDTSTAPPIRAQLDGLAGQSYHAMLANGKVTEVKPVKEGDTPPSITGLISLLVPRIRPGLKVGAAWSDTAEVSNDVPGGNMKTRTITNYKANAMEMRDGVNALKVDAASSSAISGQQNGNTFEGTGVGSATYYVAPDGRLVASNVSSTSTLAVTAAQLPEPIPVTIKTTVAVTTIK